MTLFDKDEWKERFEKANWWWAEDRANSISMLDDNFAGIYTSFLDLTEQGTGTTLFVYGGRFSSFVDYLNWVNILDDEPLIYGAHEFGQPKNNRLEHYIGKGQMNMIQNILKGDSPPGAFTFFNRFHANYS